MKLLNKKNLQLNVQGLGYNLMSSQNGNILSQSQMIKLQQTTHNASQQPSLTASAPLLQGQQPSILQQKLCFKDKMTKIIEGIYVGNYLSAMDQKNLIKENITHIINCSPSDCPNLFEKDFTYLNINIQDNWKTNLFLVIYIILDFLRNALEKNGRVLIHCNQGISRSPSIVIAYLIYTEKINANIALEKLKKKYPYADPNLDFQIQLNEMYKEVVEDDAMQRSRQSSNNFTCRTDVQEIQTQNIQSQQIYSTQSVNIITEQKKSKQLVNSSSHITISTPDQPQQKLNYDSYILKQGKPSQSSANLNLQQNQTNSQNGLYQNQSVKIQINTISPLQNNTSSIDAKNEKRESSLLNLNQDLMSLQQNCIPPKNSPEQVFLKPDLQYLKNKQNFTLEQKQQVLFKRVHSQNTQNTDESDIDSPKNMKRNNNIENKYYLSQKIQKSSKDMASEINNSINSSENKGQLDFQQEITVESESINSPPISAKQALQMSIHSQQENNCDENTEIQVKSPIPIKKNNQKSNQSISIGYEEKEEDLKNKLSDSDIDPLDSTDIQDCNTDTSASFSFDVSSSFNNAKPFKTHNLSANSSTNQSSTQNSQISQAKYHNKHESSINLACTVVLS
ncbi:hypothetical protein ABPG72_003969 [Tetrahymena utriculariae]